MLLLKAQISIILLLLLRSPKNYHKTKATLNTSRRSGILTENVITVGGQGLSDPCENERVDVFIGLNI